MDAATCVARVVARVAFCHTVLLQHMVIFDLSAADFLCFAK